MIVTKYNYFLQDGLVKKLDIMIKRCHGKGHKGDAVLAIEGGEGEGKTTFSIAIGYYIADQTGRTFNSENIFFDIEKMIKFAQNNEKKIIIWDEPALQALSTDWASKAVKNLTRLLMMARKKRHFIIMNMTKFYKFNEYIMVDRALGMIHVYSRRNVEPGRFIYIKKKNLEPLWRDYRYAKKRNYFKHGDKRIRSTFPDILSPKYKGNVLADFNMDDYEARKDEAISSIGVVEVLDKNKRKILYLQWVFANLPGVTQKDKAKFGDFQRSTVSKWGRLVEKYPEILGYWPKKANFVGNHINN